jgi:hypothetical protein
MTFDLHPDAAAARDRARSAAARLGAAAATLDATAVIPDDLRAAVHDALAAPGERLARVVGLEELAAVSGSLAADALLAPSFVPAEPAPGWAGLRGVPAAALHAAGDAEGCAVAALLVGLGRGALTAALAAMHGEPPESRPEQRHWSVADAAAELDAARLLVWRAASAAGVDAMMAAMARLQARVAAEACVAAARRVLGAAGAGPGSVVDRITRDVATAVVVFAVGEADERAVADGVLPL